VDNVTPKTIRANGGYILEIPRRSCNYATEYRDRRFGCGETGWADYSFDTFGSTPVYVRNVPTTGSIIYNARVSPSLTLRTCKYVCTSHTLAATCILPNWMSVMALSRLFSEKYLGNRIFCTSPKACLAKLKYKLNPGNQPTNRVRYLHTFRGGVGVVPHPRVGGTRYEYARAKRHVERISRGSGPFLLSTVRAFRLPPLL